MTCAEGSLISLLAGCNTVVETTITVHKKALKSLWFYESVLANEMKSVLLMLHVSLQIPGCSCAADIKLQLCS